MEIQQSIGASGGAGPLNPKIFSKLCSFQAILRKKPILSKCWVQSPLWGQNSAGPPEQKPGSAPEESRISHPKNLFVFFFFFFAFLRQGFLAHCAPRVIPALPFFRSGPSTDQTSWQTQLGQEEGPGTQGAQGILVMGEVRQKINLLQPHLPACAQCFT